MSNSHERAAREDIAPDVVAAFYAGATVRDIGLRLNKTEGQIVGVLFRARAARHLTPGREAESFLAEESAAFVMVMKAGRSPEAAAQGLGKSPYAGVKHAKALGLIAKRRVSPVAREAALSDRNLAPAKAADHAKPDAARDRVDARASGEITAHEAGDARLVAALIAQGGFHRYDDGLDWLLDMNGDRVVPISAQGKTEFLAAMRAKHGEAVTAIASAAA